MWYFGFRAWKRKYWTEDEPFFGAKIKRWSATEEDRPPIPALSSSEQQTQPAEEDPAG
jgi:hypothetical protein